MKKRSFDFSKLLKFIFGSHVISSGNVCNCLLNVLLFKSRIFNLLVKIFKINIGINRKLYCLICPAGKIHCVGYLKSVDAFKSGSKKLFALENCICEVLSDTLVFLESIGFLGDLNNGSFLLRS